MNPINKDNLRSSIKNSLQISRFQSLKYFNAILFFINFYWIIVAYAIKSVTNAIIPAISIILITACFFDQYFAYQGKSVEIKKSINLYLIYLIMSIIVLIFTIVDYKLILAFISNKLYAQIAAIVNILIALFCYIKSKNISKNTDRLYRNNIKHFENN